jgi:hypothetical protein
MDKDTQIKLRQILDREMARVDRVERMPSPYLWQVLEEMEQRIESFKGQMESLNKALQNSKELYPENVNVVNILKIQDRAIWQIASALAKAHTQVDQLRADYRHHEKGTNVLDLADQEERYRQQQLDHKLSEQMVKSMPSQASRPAAPAPGGSLFGSAPAPGSSLFGASAPSSGSFSFGISPAPAPSSGGLFGSTPAPAPSGGLFGSTHPAPAPSGGLFGSTTPAPPPSGGLFGSTTLAPAPFGSAAPAPAAGDGFSFGGATTPTAAPAFGGFGNAPAMPSSTTSTPKTKNKSRSTRRR